MRGKRILVASLIAIFCVLAPTRNSLAGPQKDNVCQGSCGGGCGPCPGEGGSSSYSGGGGIAWGHVTSQGLDKVKDCGNKPFCVMFRLPLVLMIGALYDGPYYAAKGVGYGFYYGGKGLYYGGRGLGQGLAYTGRAIGRGLAYPFNRPPKPILPPTTWEQYKHDVLRHQKRLAKANKANKENQRWCVKNVPLEISPNRARWEGLCNAGDAVSRAALPPDLVAAALATAPGEASKAAVIPDAAAPVIAAPAAASIPPDPTVPSDAAVSKTASATAAPALQDPSKALAGGDTQVKTAGQGGFDSKEAMLGQQSPAPQKPTAESSPQKPPITDANIPASLAPEVPFINVGTPTLLSKGSAPDFPSSFGTPEQVGAVLAPALPPATPEAYTYLSRAAGFVAKRGLDRTREVITKTAKKAVSTEFGPAVVLINMYNLPETILPKIIKMVRGELSVEEGNMLTLEAVNVLYNFGAVPNEVLAKIIGKRDAMKGIFAYGADEASDKLSVALGKGIAGLTGEMHANARYPQMPQLKGSTAGRVNAIFNQNLKDLTTADVRRKVRYYEDVRKELISASRALSADEKAREIHEP